MASKTSGTELPPKKYRLHKNLVEPRWSIKGWNQLRQLLAGASLV